MRLGSVDDLRAIYRPPGRGPVDKVIHQLDQHCADFLAKSPLSVLSSADAEGVLDGSPKGGLPASSGCSTSSGWPGRTTPATAACIVKYHAAIDDARERDLRATLWEPGGAPAGTAG